MIRSLVSIAVLSLAASLAQAQTNVCLQPSDGYVPMQGCDASLQSVSDPNPVSNVAKQAMIPGPMILWVGRKSEWAQTVANFPAFIAESKKYPGKFPWVYLYDEIGWCASGLCWFNDEDTVLQGAALAHANGLKTLVTITPDVIMDARFALKNINAFDGISIDVYPSIRPTEVNFKGCKYSDNPSENLFYCAAQKLRALGFTGQIGYIYQGFGLTLDTREHRLSYLTMQQHAIRNASAMGATAVMAWGCRLGKPELAAEPILVPLCGTEYEWLLKK